MVFETLLDPVFGPLLKLEPIYTILILAFGITFLITLAYKYLTDQKEMKRLKKEMKSYQKKMKKLQKEDPKKAMEVQKQAMEVNMKYMKQSFKPTLYTFIPIIIIFGWMNAHLVYAPIGPGEDFMLTAQMVDDLPGEISLSTIPEMQIDNPIKEASQEVSWTVSADNPGEYDLIVKYNDKDYQKSVLISETNYVSPEKTYEGSVQKLSLNMERIRPLGDISLLGWRPGWLGTYILLSIIFSIGLRKILKLS